MHSVSINTRVVSSNPDHGKVYSIQHYVIVCQWLATGRWFSAVSSTNKLIVTINEIMWKVALNTRTLILNWGHYYGLIVILGIFQKAKTQNPESCNCRLLRDGDYLSVYSVFIPKQIIYLTDVFPCLENLDNWNMPGITYQLAHANSIYVLGWPV